MKMEAFAQSANTEKPKESISINTREFKTKEGDIVTLKWTVREPKKEEGEKPETSSKAVVFLPGVGLEANSPSVLKSVEDFANTSGETTYAISASINNPKAKDSQAVQAEAIKEFIISNSLKEITLVGHSQGANKSIELASFLENNSESSVRGLILTNPAGLYDQDPSEAAKNFFKDAALNTPLEVIRQKLSKAYVSNVGAAIKLGQSAAGNIAKEFFKAPAQFSDKAKREAEESSTLNLSAQRITAPVIIILGAKDAVFESKKLVPNTAGDQSLRSQDERIKEMKKIFTNSQGIKVVVASRLDTHGLHYFRSEEVAKVGLGLLERMERYRVLKAEEAAA